MTSKTIILQLGGQPQQLPVPHIAEVQTVQTPYAPKLTFYTAQDADEKIVGVVQVNAEAREAQAEIVFGWIKAGLRIDVKAYKELNKILSAEQKVIDEAAKAAKAIVDAEAAKLVTEPVLVVAPAAGETVVEKKEDGLGSEE
jgi:hypothetical protein